MASSFYIRENYSPYNGRNNSQIGKDDDYMLWIGIAFVLIGVFLIGKSSK